MPWFFPWSEGIKKRACRYLLQRYLGQFLQEKLSLDQLSVDLYNGTGTISDVNLDVETLNELGETYNLPVEFVDGFISSIAVNIPWSSLLADSSYVEVKGLLVTIQPKQRQHSGSMFDSIWGSMTTSMQLAEECLKQEADNVAVDEAQPFEGLEIFAQTIDSVLCRTKIRFIDTVIRLEHVPKDGTVGVALEMRIKKFDYFDEAGTDVTNSTEGSRSIYVAAAFATKKFYLEGVSLYSDEFPYTARTFARSLSSNNSSESKKSDLFATAPVSPDLPPPHIDLEKTCGLGEDQQTTSNTVSFGPDPVLIGKWMGCQEIRLKLKQADSVPGPKVDIEANLGSTTYFLSPRQVHILLELLSGLTSPDLEDDSNVTRRQLSDNKPMEAVDFERVEEELQRHMHPQQPGRALQHQQGWSSQSLEDSDDDFHPLASRPPNSNTPVDMQSSTSSLGSTLSGSGISSVKKPKQKSYKSGHTQAFLDDSSAELTHYKVRVSHINIVILHDDILTLTADTQGRVAQSSVNHMKAVADRFFHDHAILMSSVGNKSIQDMREDFAGLCKLNHLRLSGSPLIIEGDERTCSSSICMLSANVSCGTMEIVECLKEEQRLPEANGPQTSKHERHKFTELLVFDKTDSGQWANLAEPSFRMKIKHLVKIQGSHSHGMHLPTTDIHVSLGPCQMEVDISILDRITALLHPPPKSRIFSQSLPMYHNSSTKMSNQACFTQAMEDGDSGIEHRVNFKLSTTKVAVKLRFPIPDLRAVHDMERTPWWQQSIRKDILTLQLSAATLTTVWGVKNICTEVEVTFHSMEGLYQESIDDPIIPFMSSQAEDKETKADDIEHGFGWPRLLLRIYPAQNPVLFEEEPPEDSMDAMPVSFVDNIVFQMNQSQDAEPSPFSSRRVVYENQHSHRSERNEKYQDPFCDNEKMVMPGDKAEMTQFMEKTSSNCQLQLEANLPNLVVMFPNKHFYEILYNRLSTDLFLWEPTAPKPVVQMDPGAHLPPRLDLASTLMNETIYQTFSLCKSTVQWDSSSDSDEETHMYHSVYEHKQKYKRQQHDQKNPSLQNRMAVTITSNQTRFLISSPYRDASGAVVPGHKGELYLEAKDSLSYILAGFCGQPDTGFICVQSNHMALYHEGMLVSDFGLPSLKEISAGPHSALLPTILQSERGIPTRQSGLVGTGGDSLDMLSLAIRINYDHVANIKTFQVALGIRDATLQYRVCPSHQNWINQFIDFFDVRDLPIAGYLPPVVVTELHLHLWGCAVDYRPLFLPLRALIAVESFSVSSNITAQTSSSLLRFIAEETNLYISNKCDSPVVDLRNNYVSVVEVGFFDLSLRITDGKEGKHPRVDLQASNSIVHIRTCSDSCAALQDLLMYFASDGDLLGKPTEMKSDPENSQSSGVRDTHEKSFGEVKKVYDLMEEAMLENQSNYSTSGGDFVGMTAEKSCLAPEDVFLFPDESSAQPTDNIKGLGDRSCNLPVPDEGSTDEGFCILEDDPGLGIRPKSGEPEVRILSADPVRLIENYFTVPLGKIDQLKAPKHFPSAVLRYTLQEMSLVWHMHGGRDFDPPTKTDKKVGKEKQVKISEPHDSSGISGVSYSKTRNQGVHWVKNGPSPVNSNNNINSSGKRWQDMGGPGRRQDMLMELQMNKVRFRYEVYPEHTEQAARQVLVIHEFEIRDRLATSQFNKFLYQHSSEEMPRQSNANMLVVKALHVRPDPSLPAQECSLRVALLPLRLNIDQDALHFLYTFYTEISSQSLTNPDTSNDSKPIPKAPVMMTGNSFSELSPPEPQQLLIMLEETQGLVQDLVNPLEDNQEAAPASPLFFRSFVFAPDVLIKLDYQGKHVDTHQLGVVTGLLMGLGNLHSSQVKLKRLCYRHGLLGIDKLLSYVITEWIEDIRKNQIHGVLAGVGPCYSVVQFVRGIRDLLWLPIEQYRKDGRFVRGLQRGANAFTKSTAMAALELTNRLVQTIQSAAETAYDMVTPGPSIKKQGVVRSSRRKRPSQPVDIREGVANAYQVVKEGLGDTARTILRVASEEHEQKGISGAVGGVLRQIPPTVVKPIILATEATSNVLGGMRHQLVPDARKEAAEKWRSDDT